MPFKIWSFNKLILDSQWGVLGICWFTFFMSHFTRENWLTIIPFASETLGLTKTQSGLFITAFYIGYVILQIPAGILIDRLKSFKIFGAVLIAMGVTTFLTGLINNFFQGLILEFLTGISGCFVFPLGIKIIATYFPKNKRGTATGIFLMAPQVGKMLVGLILPSIMLINGWRWGFFATGIPSIIFGIFLIIFFKKDFRETSTGLESISRSAKIEIKALFSNRNTLLILISIFLFNVSRNGINTWLYDYLVTNRGVSEILAGVIFSSLSIGVIFSTPFFGLLSDRFKERKSLAFTSAFLYAIALLIFGTLIDPIILVSTVFCMGLISSGFSAPMFTLATESVMASSAGTTGGFINMFGQSASIIAPTLFGYILDISDSYSWVFIFGAAISACAGVFALFLKKKNT